MHDYLYLDKYIIYIYTLNFTNKYMIDLHWYMRLIVVLRRYSSTDIPKYLKYTRK